MSQGRQLVAKAAGHRRPHHRHPACSDTVACPHAPSLLLSHRTIHLTSSSPLSSLPNYQRQTFPRPSLSHAPSAMSWPATHMPACNQPCQRPSPSHSTSFLPPPPLIISALPEWQPTCQGSARSATTAPRPSPRAAGHSPRAAGRKPKATQAHATQHQRPPSWRQAGARRGWEFSGSTVGLGVQWEFRYERKKGEGGMLQRV